MNARAEEDSYAGVWPESGPDIITALAAVPDGPAAGPQDAARLPRRPQGRSLGDHRPPPASTPGPYARTSLARVANGIRRMDDPRPRPVVIPRAGRDEELPLHAAAMAAHSGTAPQPARPVQAAIPDDGRLRGLLARMAAYAADVTEPLFTATCERCGTALCARHAAQREESAGFRRLAVTLGSAASDRDALALIAAAASGHREVSAPAWPGQRDRAVSLLTRAESAAFPDVRNCCSEEEPCGSHAEDQETAGFVGAIRDAAIDAGSAAEAAALIAAVITEGAASS